MMIETPNDMLLPYLPYNNLTLYLFTLFHGVLVTAGRCGDLFRDVTKCLPCRNESIAVCIPITQCLQQIIGKDPVAERFLLHANLIGFALCDDDPPLPFRDPVQVGI